MFGVETYKILKACADRCKLCKCYKLPRLSAKNEGEFFESTLRCVNCGVKASGQNMHLAICEWNKLQRKRIIREETEAEEFFEDGIKATKNRIEEMLKVNGYDRHT